MKLLSIIVPIYNVEQYLQQCINGLINLKYENKYEILLIDDCGQDNSLKIAKQYQKNYPHLIKLISHEKNYGLSVARNTGLANACAEYIMFIDSDDWLSDECLPDLFAELEKYKPDMLFFDHNHVWPTHASAKHYDNNIKKTTIINFENKEVQVINLYCMACSSVYKRTLFQSVTFPINVLYEDLATIPAINLKCNKVLYIPKCYYQYRQHDDSIMANSGVNPSLVFKALDVLRSREGAKASLGIEFVCIRKLLLFEARRLFSSNKAEAIQFIDQAIIWLKMNYPNWTKNPYLLDYQKPNNQLLSWIPKFYLQLLNCKLGRILFLYRISFKAIRIKEFKTIFYLTVKNYKIN